ncbi:MAG: polysaccharide deacetylase family protein, partial [Chloroflexia bacterium]
PSTATPEATVTKTATAMPSATPTEAPTATATAIPEAERVFVPILCYHYIREYQEADSEDDRAYVTPPGLLDEQLSWLKENGYTGVTAPQVYDYLINGKALPPKPIMLSFDDNQGSQYTDALPLLTKYGFNATFFIMTVTIDKENFMSAEQLKDLDAKGFDIEAHTWDHHMVTQYTEEDNNIQLVQPKKTLEDLLGHPVKFFAYPFGVYDGPSAQNVEKAGYVGAFSLREVMDDTVKPQYAIKRYITNSYWTMDQFEQVVTGQWE